MSKRPSAEVVPHVNEIVASREPFFESGITIADHDIFCGDKRQVIGAGHYIHIFGGALNATYNLAVLKETAQPDSVTEPFETQTEAVVPAMLAKGIKIGVHSDLKTEKGEKLRADSAEGPVGCVYAQARLNISKGIGDNSETTVTDAARLRPELFQTPEDFDFAYAVTGAHCRLAERAGFLSEGRKAVIAANKAGSKPAVVDGDTEAKVVGLINLAPNSSIRSGEAMAAGFPAFVQDSWAAKEVLKRLQDDFPYDSHEAQIAEAIDTVGTFHALGLGPEDIAVRR